MTIKLIAVFLYAAMIIFIGIAGLKKTKTFSDFFLGGGKIGPWMTAFTYGTAYFSAVLFIGFAGKIGWGFGYSGLWIAVGNAFLGVLGVWLFLGPRIKKMAVEFGVSTMAEFFEKRYGSRFLKLFSSVSVFVFFIPYSAAVFIGLSYLFKSNFNWDYPAALAFMGVFTAVYLALGGYKSMTMIDVIFGIIMCIGVIVLVAFVLDKGEGLANITASLKAIDPKLTGWAGPPGIWPLFCLVFLTSAAPFGMPQLIQKFYAIKDRRSIKIGMAGSTFFAVLVVGAAYFIGATARIFLSPENAPQAFKNGKPVFDALMPELIANVIPPSLSVVILLLILSASMSTLAALVLVSSSSAVKDIYAGFINKNATDRRLTELMRISSIFFILLSVILAFLRPATIVAILAISWGAVGSVFLGPFVWGLFSSKTTKKAAVTSSVTALSLCIILYLSGRSSPEAGTIGMLISLAMPPVITAVSPGQSKTA